MTWLLAITALWLLGAVATYRWMARELDADNDSSNDGGDT